jgi:hypothetical protein
MQLHQLVMLQCFHQVGLCQESLHWHAPRLHCFHRHFGVLVIDGWRRAGSREGG